MNTLDLYPTFVVTVDEDEGNMLLFIFMMFVSVVLSIKTNVQ